jgi:NAD(P)-dependent dehydrogenase (short-subunit alcohol dehydrogenase family)
MKRASRSCRDKFWSELGLKNIEWKKENGMAQQQSPVWFITGCSTGFGKELAKLVLARGWRAVVTARNPDQLKELVSGQEENALALQLDVTDRAQIAQAVQQTEEKFGRIDVLVNNAGYGYLAAVEEGEEDQIRAMFETNFFGLVALTNAVLPGMRKRRSGHIANFSSIGGLVSFAATGYYHATKYAVEGLSESLSIELAPLGIKVLIVEPGPFRTDWAGRSLLESRTVIDDYDSTAGERRRQSREQSGKQQGDPVRAGEAIIEAVGSENPPLHLLLGKPALEMGYKKLEAMKKDFDSWRQTTLGADYPEFQDAK